MTVYRELLEIAMQYHGGDAMKARADVKECMENIKETLTAAEKVFFGEKVKAFLNDGYNTEEADAEALDMVIRKRPVQGTAAATEIPPQARKSMTRQNNLDGLKNYVKGRSA